MRHHSRITLIVLGLSVLVAGVAFSSHDVLARWVTDFSGRLLAPISQRIGYGRALASVLLGRSDLLQENINLKDEIERAHAAVAKADEVSRENSFLRAAAGLRDKIQSTPVEAGVFGYLREGGLREVVVNRGKKDGISNGDIVITANGALLGLVQDASEAHSLVRVLGDPAFEVTARVVGTDIAGLLHRDTKEGLILDLIKKDEPVSEGQSLTTSGNDNFPAGILIGTVRSVDKESATLFKIVRITPAISDDFSGKVLIFHP